eukprot:1468451-Amphidinium_carterae.1
MELYQFFLDSDKLAAMLRTHQGQFPCKSTWTMPPCSHKHAVPGSSSSYPDHGTFSKSSGNAAKSCQQVAKS